jgi:replicative DNA helicase
VNDQTPWSHEAEVELLGAPLVDPSCLDLVADLVDVADFYHASHQRLHTAQRRVWARERKLDYPMLMNELSAGGMDRAEAQQLMSAAFNRSGTTHNVANYARIVSGHATLRRIIETCEGIAYEATQQPDDVEAFACRAEAQLRDVAERGAPGTIQSADEGMTAAMERVHAAKAGDESVLGLLTGFRELDRIIEGLQIGINTVAGRPGNGKSAFALQVARRVAERGDGVFLWSGEMPDWKCWTRMAACMARYCWQDLTGRATVHVDDMARVQQAAAVIGSLPIEADFQAGLTVEQICVRAQRARRKLEAKRRQLRLVVVDHFHKINHRADGNRDDSKMNDGIKRLADWAKNNGLHVLLPAQFNREAGKRGGDMPRLHDLRECGGLEEESEIVFATHFAWHHDDSAQRGLAKIPVLKNRGGDLGVLDLAFDGPPMRFMERYHE